MGSITADVVRGIRVKQIVRHYTPPDSYSAIAPKNVFLLPTFRPKSGAPERLVRYRYLDI